MKRLSFVLLSLAVPLVAAVPPGSNLTGVPQIFTVSSAGGWPDQVTAFEDPVGSVSWSPDGSRLAFSLAPGGGMNQQVYLVRPDGRTVYLASDKDRDREVFAATRLREDGGPGPIEVLAERADAELADFEIEDSGVKAANGALRKNGVKDIESCVEAVVKAGAADPGRLGIMGGSVSIVRWFEKYLKTERTAAD
jgi:WD40-like Beta Propeller Repeat.